MSTRVISAPIGAAIGFAIGGPGGALWGWQIGATAGAILDPQTIKGPSLGDIAAQTSQEGGPIPIVYGVSSPIAGNIISTSPPRIQKKKSGGKGGPKVETETVYRTYAIGICEGPIGGILRVWRNNTKVYDALDPEFTDRQSNSSQIPGWAGGGTVTTEVQSRNEAFLEKARFFLGTYDQEASPDLEAIHGVGTTPSYRGLAYMVMADEDVTDVGGMVPQWLFQVGSIVEEKEPNVGIVSINAGNSILVYDRVGNLLNRATIPTQSNRALYRAPVQESVEYATYYSVTDAFGNVEVRKIKIYPDGNVEWGEQMYFPLTSISSLFASSNLSRKIGVMKAGYSNNIVVAVRLDGTIGSNRYGVGWVNPETGDGGGFILSSSSSSQRIVPNVTRDTNPSVYFTEGNMYWGFQSRTIGLETNIPSVYHVNIFEKDGGSDVTPNLIQVAPPSSETALLNLSFHIEGVSTWMSPQTPTRIAKCYPSYSGTQFVPTADITSIQCSQFNGIGVILIRDISAPVGEGALYYKLSPDGSVTLLYNPNDDFARGYVVLNDRVVFQHYRPGSTSPPFRYVSIDINTGAVISDEVITQPYTDYEWGNGSAIQVSEVVFPHYRDSVYSARWIEEPPSLRSVVEDICSRSGIGNESIDIDAIDVGASVHGLVITNQYPASQAIRSLGQVYRFDVTKYDGKIRFIPRGGNSVATITEDDMVSENDAPIDANNKRSDAIGIPRVLNLSYYDIDSSGLTPIKQTSERSGDRRAVGDASVQSPVIMDADTAAQSVAVSHAVMIEEQKGELKFALPDNWLKLVPTDPVIVQWEGKSERCRLTQVEILDGYQRYVALRDRQSSYTSDVEGLPPPIIPPPPSRVPGPTVVIPLDIPIVQDSDDSLGMSYYVAVAGLTSGWSGATIELSYDGGANYVQSKPAALQSIIGVLVSPLPDHPADYPDYTNTFEVELFSPGSELADTDLAGMMNRTNLAAVGNFEDGWELINFSDVHEVDPETRRWSISGLLRGRRATRTRAHAEEDILVMIDRSLVAIETASVSDISSTLTFRATSSGEATSSGTIVSIEYNGNSQRERPPSYLFADKDGDNLFVSFQGVGRIGGGAVATHGIYFTEYRVTVTDAASSVQQETVSSSPVVIPSGAMEFPVVVRVEQMNELTGAGDYEEVTVSDNTIIPSEGAVDIVFGGTPTENDAVFIQIQYRRTASSSMMTFGEVVSAAELSPDYTPEDFADALYSALSTFFSGEPVSVSIPSPETVRIAPSVSYLFMVSDPVLLKPKGTEELLQEPLPVQAGVKQVISLDLYQSVSGAWIPAPDPSNAYKTGGSGQFNFSVIGLTWDKRGRRPGAEMWPISDNALHGEIFSVPNNIWTSPGYSMSDVVSRFSSSSLANMDYFDNITMASSGGRNVVQITMADGWRVPDTYIGGVSTGSSFGISPGNHPSGYRPGIKQITAGVPAFPSGAKKSVSLVLSNTYVVTTSGSVRSSWIAGEDVVIELDGIPYSHELTADEASALNADGSLTSEQIGYINDVYEALGTAIEAGGNFDVYLDAYANGLYAGLRIERKVIDNDFTLSTTVTGYGLTAIKD